MKTASHWEKVGFFPHHGICLPLSALRTQQSSGIGEFLDLLPLIEWCKEIGFDCLQLLPLNDQGMDLSPYNPLSSCALDPIYLSLKSLPDAKDLEIFAPYNTLPRLARREVKTLKMQWLHRYFENAFPSVEKTKEYQAFLKKYTWLTDYVRFMTLKERYNYLHWKDWPSSLYSPTQKELDFHSFVQYLCFSQLEKVRSFATSSSFLLIGDLPILLSGDSADVWAHPSLFRLDLAAGAPPDRYNVRGQKWGFPLFNWDEMYKTDFGWWKERLHTIESLYHIYRLDHVVGFFRIWAIPLQGNPEEGSFIPPDSALWEEQGKKILQILIDHCSLLPIAEDLGTIPPFVPSVLKDLGICGMKILRWQGDLLYEKYEPLSITAISTPDMEPLALWWQKHPEEATSFAKRKHWAYEVPFSAKQQIAILKDAHHTASLFHINPFQEYLFAFPELKWGNWEEERINVPGILSPTNWTYRFRPYLEEIIKHGPFAKMLREVLSFL